MSFWTRAGIPAIALAVAPLAGKAAFAEGAAAGDGHLATESASAKGPASAAKKAGRSQRPKRLGPGSWWLNLGANFARVEGAGANCWGGRQIGVTAGRTFFLRAQHAYLIFDDSDDCSFFWLIGNARIAEESLLLGIVSQRSGLFVAAGPAHVDVGTPVRPNGTGTGQRYELGWSSRHVQPSTSRLGVELVLFATRNDVRDHAGIALSATFGPRN